MSGSNLFGEIRRFARTSGAVGGIAARVAGERVFGIKTDRAAHAEDLKAILGGLKGPLMKVAQFLSTVPDALPAEYAMELAQLQSNAPAMGWSFVRRRMANELGPDWQAKFASFSQEASAAASLGQVHRARLPDGTEVACKLQYPDMPSTVEADLRQLKLAMAVYHRMDSAIQHDEIYKEMRERLREELDYLREAAQMRMYGQMLKDQPGAHVPVPLPELSTHRLLTMTWLDGRPLMQRLAEDPPQEERNKIAEALFRAWYVPFYRYGVIHGDPHLGNYQVRPDGSVNLLDFGAIRVFGRGSSPASSNCSRRCATTMTIKRTTPTKPGASPTYRVTRWTFSTCGRGFFTSRSRRTGCVAFRKPTIPHLAAKWPNVCTPG